MTRPDPNQSALSFWEELYKGSKATTNGRPSAVLERLIGDQTPGTALELGCAKGDDAVWLAKQGWQVTAVDISQTALTYAQSNAETQGVDHLIEFQQHDLAESFPDCRVDLVTAMFLHTPIDFPRTEVLRKAAARVNPGGLLLIVSHGSTAPWSWGDPNTRYPSARDLLNDLKLGSDKWRELQVGGSERTALGPREQRAQVIDTIVFVKRL